MENANAGSISAVNQVYLDCYSSFFRMVRIMHECLFGSKRVKPFYIARLVLPLIFAILGMPWLARGAITVDANSSKNTGANTSNVLPISGDSWSHTVSGANTILIVGVAINQAGTESVSSVTFNGRAFTLIGTATRSGQSRVELWYQVAPDTGTHAVQVLLNTAARFVAGATSYNMVDQTTPLGAFAGANGNSKAASVNVTSEPGDLVVDIMGYDDSSTYETIGAGQTLQWTDTTSNGSATLNAVGASSTEGGATTVTMSWALRFKENWAIGAVSLKPFLDDFNYSKKITIDRSKVGVTGTSITALSNYPMLYKVTDADLKTVGYGGHVQNSNGYDIMFRGLDAGACGVPGTNSCSLSHQVEKYDPTTGELIAWVKMPSLNTNAASSDTAIYIYFGNSSITSSLETATSVWDSNFQAVWHMSDNAANTTVVQSTSITNPGNGIAAANTSAKTASGQIAGALAFNGSTDYIYQNSTTALSNLQGYTLSAWIRTSTTSGHKVLGLEGARTGTASTNYDRHLYIGSDGKAYVGCYSTAAITAASNSAVNDNAWHYLTAHLNDTGYVVRMYVDGDFNTSASLGANCENTTGYWRMGNYKLVNWTSGSDGYYTGTMDEVRISNAIRSADWIKTDYNNQSSPSTFYGTGTLQTSPITMIQLISFTADNYLGLVQLKWKTGYEVSNLGFRIYREDKGDLIRVTPSIVAGSALMARGDVALTSGRTYTWQDPVGDSPGPFRYWLEDVDTNGTSTWHGPVTAVDNESDLPEQVQSVVLSYLGKGASRSRSDGSPWRQWTNGVAETERPLLSAMRLVGGSKPMEESLAIAAAEPDEQETMRVQWDLAERAKAKILIKEAGWYRVTQPQLIQAGLGAIADSSNLQLYANGEEQPMQVHTQCSSAEVRRNDQDAGRNKPARCPYGLEFGEGDWIEFYGTGVDTAWTDTRVYWLIEGNQRGKRIGSIDGAAGWSGIRSLPTTMELKAKTVYWSALRNGDEENFFGSLVSGEGAEEVLQVEHLDELANRDGWLEVELQGVTETNHSVQIEVNGIGIGSLPFDGQAIGSERFLLSPGVLQPGGNRIRLVAQNGEEDISLVKTIRVSYWRTPEADEDALQISVPGYEAIMVGGFTSSTIRAMDVTDPLKVTEVTGTIAPQGDGYAITVSVPEPGERKLFLFEESRVQAAAGVEPNNLSVWNRTTSGADVVIISHGDFVGRLGALKTQQEAEGYRVALANVEDLYGEFGYGEKTPYALKRFLQKAQEDWRNKPRFLLLAGDASFDPRNYLGLGDFDYVPTKLIDTALMETASDDWYGDLDGNGIAEIAVGRLSVRTLNEAQTQIAKILEYRQRAEPGDWAKKVMLVADTNDEFDFEAASDQLSEEVPESMIISKIYRGQMDNTSAREQVLGNLNAGALLMNYFGHGSVEVWRGDLLTSAAAAGLTNGTRLPFVIAMNCLNGFFDDIYTESLAESLMKAPNGGAVAVWASSGLTDANIQQAMNLDFFRQLFGSDQTVGEAIMKVKASMSDPDVRRTWVLFGDPTIKLVY
jgi:hypothetical protein